MFSLSFAKNELTCLFSYKSYSIFSYVILGTPPPPPLSRLLSLASSFFSARVPGNLRARVPDVRRWVRKVDKERKMMVMMLEMKKRDDVEVMEEEGEEGE